MSSSRATYDWGGKPEISKNSRAEEQPDVPPVGEDSGEGQAGVPPTPGEAPKPHQMSSQPQNLEVIHFHRIGI